MVHTLVLLKVFLPVAATLAAAAPASTSTENATIPLGGPIACMMNSDGSGDIDYNVTKDCCAAVNHKAYFNELSHKCMDYAGPAGNSVDWGAMVRCCGNRGRGSHGD